MHNNVLILKPVINNMAERIRLLQAVCTKAHYIFTTDTGLVLFLDFDLNSGSTLRTGCSAFVTDLIKLNQIRMIANKDKPDYESDEMETADIEKLIGMKASVHHDTKTERCTFIEFDAL